MQWHNVPDDPDDWYGFTYLIVNEITGQRYIGRKYFHSYRKGKRVKQSNWKTYTSSSKEVNADIKELGIDNFSFYILDCYRTRQEVNYAEVEQQVIKDVLRSKTPTGEFEYYNSNIMSRFFRQKEYGTPEFEQKQQEAAQLRKEKYLNANQKPSRNRRRSSGDSSGPKRRSSKVSS